MRFENSLLAILLLVSPFVCLSQSTSIQDNDSTPLVTVTGIGAVNVVPDQAQIQIGVNQRNNTLDAVVNSVDNTTQSIITYLESQGVSADDIQSSYINIQPVFGSNSSQDLTSPSYYSAQKSLLVLLTDLSNFDTIMQGLIQNGVNTVDSITFQVGNETAAINQARQAAIANAHQIATTLANDFNANLGNVFSITDQTVVQPPIPYEAGDQGTTGNSNSIAGGQITVTSNVQVSFELTNQ